MIVKQKSFEYFRDLSSFINERNNEGVYIRVIDVRIVNDKYNFIYQETPLVPKLEIYHFGTYDEYNNRLGEFKDKGLQLITVIYKSGYYEFVFKKIFN